MDDAYLGLHGLTKSYEGALRAMDRVSIEWTRGELVPFLGPSGLGKTTTLLMIARFEAPTAESIELDGRHRPRVKPYHGA